MKPFIMVAPNGARRTRRDHPALPVTIAQTVRTARACHAAGADGLHLHIRDDRGGHSIDAGRYAEALAELARVVPDLRIQVATEAAGRFSVADQLSCLEDLAPRWASIAVREIARDPALAARVYATACGNGTEVQHILYDASDAARLADWQADGTVHPSQSSVIHVLGAYTPPRPADPTEVRSLPRPCGRAMVCAFGPWEHACLEQAAMRGFDLRVGFENNTTDPTGAPMVDNAASVAHLIATLERIPV